MILGPTGTGKSRVAVLVAERLGGEIIGCDALQVYRRFDKATAKPDLAERSRVPHHLIDCCDPSTDFSLADYVREAEEAIEQVRSNGHLPIVAGGTGLYLRGLLLGVVPAPSRDPALRDRLRAMAGRHGSKRLHRWLARLDRESAQRMAPADTQRVVRALEVALKGEASLSDAIRDRGTWPRGEERYATVKIGLEIDRPTHVERLDRRVERFFRDGLVEEVEALLASGLSPEANAFKGLGYREVLEALRERRDPRQVVPLVQRNSRRYAKRQRTWFRKERDVVWLDAAAGDRELVESIVRLWRERTA